LLKNEGVKAYESLIFDMKSNSIQIYIDEISIHHKIELRDDPRIDYVQFFEESMTIVGLLK
jgi:hypothetical protein